MGSEVRNTQIQNKYEELRENLQRKELKKLGHVALALVLEGTLTLSSKGLYWVSRALTVVLLDFDFCALS